MSNFFAGLDPIGYGNNPSPRNLLDDANARSVFGQQNLINAQGTQNQSLENIRGRYGNQQAQIGANAQLGSANAAAGASRYGSDQQLAAVNAQLNQKNQRFGQLFPLLKGELGGGNSGGGFSAAGGAGAVGNYGYGTAQAPPATPGLAPAISDNQLQSNINLNNAQNWQQAAGQTRRQTQQLAGGGLGASSPLAKALQSQVFGSALQANTAGATDARQRAAELNSQQNTAAYQAQLGAQASMYGSQSAANASRYGAGLDYQAALAQVAAQKQNAILNALAAFSS